MAESLEHQFLSQTLLSILNNFSHSDLYSYREGERGKFDYTCALTESWQYLLNGQTLWKHSEGIDKDLRSLLFGSDAPIGAYIVRDTIKHKSALYEAFQDYRRSGQRQQKHLKVFWIPSDFDADSEHQRRLVTSQLQHEVLEDIVFNVLFGRLNGSGVRSVLRRAVQGGLEIAVLHSIAVDGFFSFNELKTKIEGNSSPATLRERARWLQLAGMIRESKKPLSNFHVSSAGRTFLRLCTQIHEAFMEPHSLNQETVYALSLLDLKPPDDLRDLTYFRSFERLDDSPGELFCLMLAKVVTASSRWGTDWERCNYLCSDEQDPAFWL